MVKFYKHYSGSSGNLYELRLGMFDIRIIIDPGVPFKDLMRCVGITNNTFVLLTHEHLDHSLSASKLVKMGIDLYTTKETAKACNIDDYLNVKFITPGKIFDINNLIHIFPFKTFHNAENPVGFLIKYKSYKILFAIDTSQIPYIFKDLTHIYIEANYDKNLLSIPGENQFYGNHHMEISKSLKFVEENINSKLQEVKFLHASKRFGDEEDFNYRLNDLLKSKINL